MRAIATIFFLVVADSVSLRAQSCVARSQQIIRAAVQASPASDQNQTRLSFQQAETNCPTSPVIKRQLAPLYRDLLSDPDKADALLAAAQALEGKPVQPARKEGLVHDKWALVVGISRFEYLTESGLSGPANDALAFAATLVDPNVGRFRDDGEHVHVLVDHDATLRNVMSEFDYLSRKAKADDLVVIYFSSHGTSASQDFSTSGDAQTGYIVMYDTQAKSLFSTAFAMEELKRVLNRLKAQRVVVFLDTCFSGDSLKRFKEETGAKGLAAIEDDQLERVVQGTGRVLIVSSSGSQQSWEGSNNSFFTECLIGAMKDKNGLSTVTQLFAKLNHDLPYIVQREKHADQTPLMWPQGQNLNIVIGTPLENSQ